MIQFPLSRFAMLLTYRVVSHINARFEGGHFINKSIFFIHYVIHQIGLKFEKVNIKNIIFFSIGDYLNKKVKRKFYSRIY